jgi:pyruvate carboxylase
VEHTVTEEVTGVDLVQAQIMLAQGSTLNELGLGREPTLRGYAIQAPVNMETVEADGSIRPGGGTLAAYEAPSGPGVRTDGFGYVGYRTSGAFDSLLGEGDRAFSAAGVCGLGDARRSCAERIPDRRRRYQHPVSAQYPSPPGFRG